MKGFFLTVVVTVLTYKYFPDFTFEVKAVHGFHTGGLVIIPDFC